MPLDPASAAAVAEAAEQQEQHEDDENDGEHGGDRPFGSFGHGYPEHGIGRPRAVRIAGSELTARWVLARCSTSAARRRAGPSCARRECAPDRCRYSETSS